MRCWIFFSPLERLSATSTATSVSTTAPATVQISAFFEKRPFKVHRCAISSPPLFCLTPTSLRRQGMLGRRRGLSCRKDACIHAAQFPDDDERALRLSRDRRRFRGLRARRP